MNNQSAQNPESTDANEKNPEYFLGSNQDLLSAIEGAKTTVVWDFNLAEGDTLKEKYDDFTVLLHETTINLLLQGSYGEHYVVTSPEIASIMETTSSGFEPPSHEVWQSEQDWLQKHPGDTVYCGNFRRVWQLFKNPVMPKNVALIGNGPLDGDPCRFAVVDMKNFIV